MTATHKPFRAIVLAAGFATRLYPLTEKLAKPLLTVGGEPILTRLWRQVARTDLVRDVTVVTNAKFHADFVEWRADLTPDLPVRLIDDGVHTNESRLGAIADLALALSQVATNGSEDEPAGWLVLAGDNLFDTDLAQPLVRFLASGEAQLLVRTVPEPVPPRRYSEVVLAPSGRVESFREKPTEPSSNRSAIAVYVLPPELPALVRTYLDQGGEPDAPGHILAWLVTRLPFHGESLEGRWFDIGNQTDLTAARAALAAD